MTVGVVRTRSVRWLGSAALLILGLAVWSFGFPSGCSTDHTRATSERAPQWLSVDGRVSSDRDVGSDSIRRVRLHGDTAVEAAPCGAAGSADAAIVPRFIAGLCIDSDGQRLTAGTLTIRSSSGEESRFEVKSGAFRGQLDASVGSTEIVEAMVSDDLSICVVFSGAIRVGEDLRIAVLSPRESILSGRISWAGHRPDGWRVMLFPAGVGRALSVPASLQPHRDGEDEVQLSLIDLAMRERPDPVALILVDERYQTRARRCYGTVGDFVRALEAGIEVEGTWLEIPAMSLARDGNPPDQVQCVPLDIELRRPVSLTMERGAASGLLAKERHIVVAWFQKTGQRRVGRIDLRGKPVETSLEVDWFGELPGPCALERTVVDAAGHPVADAEVEVRAIEDPWAGLIAQWLRTDAQGRVSLAELPPGPYHVRVRSSTSRTEAEETVVLPAEPRTLVLGEAEDIEVAVGFAGGTWLDAFPALEVWTADDRDPRFRAVGDRLSSASLHLRGERLRPGLRVAARVRHADLTLIGTARVLSAARRPDGRFPLELAMSQPIAGSVRDDHDQPVAGLRVVAMSPGDPPGGDALPPWRCDVSDARGEFVVHVREGDAFELKLFAVGDGGELAFAGHRDGSRFVCRLTR